MASFEHLPNEILVMCASHCSPARLAGLARTNRRFHSIFNHILYRRSLFDDPPYTPVVTQAAEKGNLDTIKLAVSFGADINADSFVSFSGTMVCEKWTSALHCACFYGHAHVVYWLLKVGAAVDGDSKAEVTPFFAALMNKGAGRTEICDLLLNAGARIALRRPDRWALHVTVARGCWSVAERILSHERRYFYPGYRPGETCNVAEAVTENGYTVLHHIAKCSDVKGIPKAVSMLVAAGAPLEATTDDWLDHDNGGTPLVHALKQLNWPVASALLENGAKLFLYDGREFGLNPLHLALLSRRKASSSSGSSLDTVKLDHSLRQKFIQDFIKRVKEDNRLEEFVEQQTVACLRGWNGTPLWYATSQAAEPALMRILLDEASACPNATVDISEGAEQANAIPRFRVSMLRALIDCYRSLWNPLKAARHGEWLVERVHILLAYGARLDAEVDQKSGLASTVLQRACQRAKDRNPELLDAIVEKAQRENVNLDHILDLEDEYWGCERVTEKLVQLRQNAYQL